MVTPRYAQERSWCTFKQVQSDNGNTQCGSKAGSWSLSILKAGIIHVFVRTNRHIMGSALITIQKHPVCPGSSHQVHLTIKCLYLSYFVSRFLSKQLLGWGKWCQHWMPFVFLELYFSGWICFFWTMRWMWYGIVTDWHSGLELHLGHFILISPLSSPWQICVSLDYIDWSKLCVSVLTSIYHTHVHVITWSCITSLNILHLNTSLFNI